MGCKFTCLGQLPRRRHEGTDGFPQEEGAYHVRCEEHRRGRRTPCHQVTGRTGVNLLGANIVFCLLPGDQVIGELFLKRETGHWLTVGQFRTVASHKVIWVRGVR